MLGFMLGTVSSAFAGAPECINHIAVNGELLEGDGFLGQSACYFTDYDNSRDAFAKAAVLAEAMGLDLTWEAESKTLVFEGRGTTARLKTTDDAVVGLQFSADALTVNGAAFRPVPLGILVDGSSWVPVGSIADAFGADNDWKPDLGLIIIEIAPQPVTSQVTTEAPSEPDASLADETAAPLDDVTDADNAVDVDSDAEGVADALGDSETFTVDAPDVGVYDGYTRVALSLPPDAPYDVAVFDTLMVITLPGAYAQAGTLEGESAQVKNLRYSAVEGDLALVISTTYALGADGRGYRVGFLPADETRALGRLYVDLGPDLQGESVTALREAPSDGLEAARAVSERRRVVVLDPGHGGRWAGARNSADTVQEEIVVLEVAFKVKALLEREGVEVVMTRTANAHLSNDYDGDLITRAGFATTARNLFVSIHANAAVDLRAHGIETFVFGEPLNESTRQAAIRENGGGAVGRAVTEEVLTAVNAMQGDLVAQETLRFSRALAESVQSHLVAETGARDRGVKQAPYRVLTQSRIPAILIETGFVSNPNEGAKLNSEDYQDRLAEGIAAGILSFFNANGSVANR